MSHRRRAEFDNSSDDSSSTSSWLSDTESDTSISEEDLSPLSKRMRASSPSSNEKSKNVVQSELNFDHVLNAQYKWVIKDFSKKSATLKVGDKIESPKFTVGYNNELEFQLFLYPKGSNEHNKNYIVVFMVLVSSKEPKLKLRLKYDVFNSKNRELNLTPIDVNSGIILGDRFGYKKLMKNDYPNRSNDLKSRGYLNHDRFVLTCDINATLSTPNNSKIQVVNDLKTLLETGVYSDLTLEVKDKKFKVHMYILAARSTVFNAMFKHDMKEKKEKVVTVSNVSPKIMKELLQFTYTGEVQNLDENAKELLAAADYYDFSDLKILCENSLIKNLSFSNAVDTLNFAELHSSDKLKEHVLKYCVTNLKDIVQTESFKTMGNSQSPLLAQMLSRVAALM